MLNVSLTQKCHIETVLVGHLFAWCHTGTLSLAQLKCPTQSQYTDTGPTIPDTNLIMPTPSETAARVPIFKTLVCLGLGRDSNSRPPSPQADALTTRLRGLGYYIKKIMRDVIIYIVDIEWVFWISVLIKLLYLGEF